MNRIAVFLIAVFALTLAECHGYFENKPHLIGVTVYGKDNAPITGDFVEDLLNEGASPAKSATTADITVGIETNSHTNNSPVLVVRDKNGSVLASYDSVADADGDDFAEKYSKSRQKEVSNGQVSVPAGGNPGGSEGAH